MKVIDHTVETEEDFNEILYVSPPLKLNKEQDDG